MLSTRQNKYFCQGNAWNTTPETAMYKVVVADTGIGMSKEYLPHIFETFTRENTSTEGKV